MLFKSLIKGLAAASIAAVLMASGAEASHFRGATLIPSVSANGTITVEAESYWRKNSSGQIGSLSMAGGSLSRTSIVTDDAVTDSRWLEVREVFTGTLSQAGTYTITFGSCCWVGGGQNQPSQGSFTGRSVIVWNGSTATKPINFDLQNIQPEVNRNTAYSDNLGVTGPGTISYSIDPNAIIADLGVNGNLPGFAISSNGTITMPLSTTSLIPDNTTNTGSGINVGADAAFFGKIISSDGSNVEFVWVFDAVNQGSGNQAPNVGDVTINAVVGANISQLIAATDPNGDPVSLSLSSFNGPGGPVAASFLDNGDDTGLFEWATGGFQVGTYIATIRGSDGSLTDTGQITINLTNGGGGNPNVIPLPASIWLLGGAIAGFGAMRRRKGKRQG
jgi:hypothetical protein